MRIRSGCWPNPIWKNRVTKFCPPARQTGALAILQNSDAVELLFTDLDLKGDIHAGIELAKAAARLQPRLKVLYTTGRAITDGMKARFLPGSGVLPKPYTVEELRNSLSRHFHISPLHSGRG
jgi:CheY-like chemotaxis protein